MQHSLSWDRSSRGRHVLGGRRHELSARRRRLHASGHVYCFIEKQSRALSSVAASVAASLVMDVGEPELNATTAATASVMVTRPPMTARALLLLGGGCCASMSVAKVVCIT